MILIGTYWVGQFKKWKGYYNYPISDADKVEPEKIDELWLFNGTKAQRTFVAEFVGIKTRKELVSEYKYPTKGSGHGDKYLLFKIKRRLQPSKKIDCAFIRLKDFAKRSPKVAAQLKQFLESTPEGRDAFLRVRASAALVKANLPRIVTSLPKDKLVVGEAALQMDFLMKFDRAAGLLQEGDPMKSIVSLFSGAGGLDLGFEKAGFPIVWANEFDKDIWATYRANHKKTYLCTKSICDVDVSEVPDCVGIIGGPPCQSWSEGGAKRGINDKRGQLFFDYIRILKAKQPLFFLAENVSGMLLDRHHDALEEIKRQFMSAGYNLSFTPVNAWNYGVPQDRERVLFVGYRKDVGKAFKMPAPIPEDERKSIRDAIGDLVGIKPGKRKNGLVEQTEKLKIPNHEFMTGGFSSIFMSRNRVRSWDEPAFTVQAGGRQSQLHPSAPKMVKISDDRFEFKKGEEGKYRRISVREAARIQTFPDSFIFHYDNIAHGYKMIGNAVPVELARVVAKQIKKDLSEYLSLEVK